MSIETYLEQNRERHLEELLELLRIPSVSAISEYKEELHRAADYLRDRFGDLGLSCEIIPTAGHPIVLAERRVSEDAPTVLIYGHYDVQPAEPFEEWESEPFEPAIRDGKIYARGASDDKGQLYAHMKGVEAALQEHPDLPLNIVFLLEGEEEVSSPNLVPFVEEHRDRLKANVVLISDGSMLGPDKPSLTYGLRGISYVEVNVRAAGRDLHSGAYGGGVANAINVLATMISKLHDEDGRITIPGFYDDVREISEEERKSLEGLPFDPESYLANVGVKAQGGERGYPLIERIWTRPSLDVNGIGGGFQGEGAKTVIAAQATAKISCRLVPDQDPEKVTEALSAHLKSLAPEGVEVEVKDLSGGHPAVVPLDSPALQLAGEALEEVWGKKPYFVRTGGSIPIVSAFQQLLDADVVLLDMGLETDQVHAPNEHFGVDNYYRGIHASTQTLVRLASLS